MAKSRRPLVKGDTNRFSAARSSVQRSVRKQKQYHLHEHSSDKTIMHRRNFIRRRCHSAPPVSM